MSCVSDIENTSTRDPLLHLAGAMGPDGSDGYITGMEADGQRQLVHSDRLPTKTLGCTDQDLTALGITLGDLGDGDPLFRPATLPAGWRRQSSDHSMWSYVVDEHGRRRLSIFYKAAFYDRRATVSVHTVYAYASDVLDNPDLPLVIDEWATAEEVSTALRDLVKYKQTRERRARCEALLEQARQHTTTSGSGDEDTTGDAR